MSRLFFVFLVVWSGIIFYSLHRLATDKNNFYFTVDQGKDAVLVREILDGKIVLKGPTTSVEGIHTGFLWPYFLFLGYKIFGAHPYGGVFLMFLLGLIQVVLLMLWTGKHKDKFSGVFIGISLIFFWKYFETTLWQFNPFPLLILANSLLFLLTEFLVSKKQKYYLFALIFILLAFHAEVAGATSLLIFYLLVGAWGVYKKSLSKRVYLVIIVAPVLFGALFLKELISVFWKTQSIYTGNATGLGTFANTNFLGMGKEYLKILTESIFPTSPLIAVIILVAAFLLFIKQSKNAYIRVYIFLTFAIFVISYIFFGSNKGWRDWHTLYLYPLVHSSFFLMLFSLPKKLAVPIFCLVFIFQIGVFQQRFKNYPHPPTDGSILKNQLAVLDWIYTHAEGDGFNAYVYTDTFYDYQYQYLFWWYGKSKFGFVPCEYANYPKSPKHTYISNYLDYSQPTLGCDYLRFLIIESDTNAQTNTDWINQFRNQTKLIEQTEIGEVFIEKRKTK